MRSSRTDDICGLCDEFDVDQAAPEYAARGQGRCLVRTVESRLTLHVDWDGRPCVSFRLDRTNLQHRQKFVAVQRRAQQQKQAPA